ncbi:hypothetical protein ABE927_15435, partial [Enterococcus gallinarum]|uniref:RusA family crossover junction endodeoxyribonuclease n=1 Tax=Enterococcus gallinarum TaxID=1353 RepID=UPI003D6ACA7A
LNKFINSQRTNRYAGAKLKKENTEKCCYAFLMAKAEGLRVTTPINLKITWYCKNKRKDPDNVAFAIKFILDGMQEARMIKNDGFNEVEAIHHHFIVDKEFPRIEIEFL